MAYQFTMPGRTAIGENALQNSETAIKRLGKNALIVSGKHVTKAGLVQTLTDLLDKWGIAFEVFNDITGEPTNKMIEAGAAAYRAAECDFLIAIGGGSPLDSAKAVAVLVTLGGDISDYLGREIDGDLPPMVMIPTTAGTGSETTKYTIITDTKNDVKMLLKGDALLPTLAVVDPVFTVSAPKEITASTGMDALTHAVESYTSRKGNVLTDMYALDAIKRIFAYLPVAFTDGSDLKAREEMTIAAYEAGVCINNASVTLVHGMSRPIGALFHVPHGISNAMLIKECLSYVLDGCYERFANIARVIGAADADDSAQEAAQAFIDALDKLCGMLNIPTLKEYGIDQDEFDLCIDKMAGDALASGSPANTIKQVSKDDMVTIYKRLW